MNLFAETKQKMSDMIELLRQQVDSIKMFKPDKGPWTVSADGKLIISDDFTHDVILTVTGDFFDDVQRKQYADDLASRLNETA